MKAKRIEKSDIKDILISSLPTRPTAPTSMGGRGYGASRMKEAFDKLPLYLVDRYNELIDDIGDSGEESLAASIPSGIKNGHTLCDLMDDVATGEIATYLTFLGKSLSEHIAFLTSEVNRLSNLAAYSSNESNSITGIMIGDSGGEKNNLEAQEESQ